MAKRSGPPAWLCAALLIVSTILVYGRALNAPFIFDDSVTILENPSITSLSPSGARSSDFGPLRPPPNSTTTGRPLVNLSFAINYYFSGTDPTGYHVVNVAIHIASALLLWAITRRTLHLDYFKGAFDKSADWLAGIVALLWALHPLQTEAVIYVSQRTELMFAFFYLATLYCSLRYWLVPLSKGAGGGTQSQTRPQRVAWWFLAVLACLAGMASKEVMISAPLIVLLFDRTFISGSVVTALRRSAPLYIGLALTWILLVVLNVTAPRGDTAGFGLGVSATSWWLTQSKVFWMYLKLVLWPWPLFIHYELPYITTFAGAWAYLLPTLCLLLTTLVLLWRNRPAGFLGAWVFVILAPTSLVPILTEMAAERRMYLPLAAIVVLVVVGVYRFLERCVLVAPLESRNRYLSVLGVSAALVLAALLGSASAIRLAKYQDEISLWRDVIEAQPDNLMAHNNLGLDLTRAHRYSEAIDEVRVALRLKPKFPEALKTLGSALMSSGRLPEAADALTSALELTPDDVEAANNLGITLMQLDRIPEALSVLQHAKQQHPDNFEVHSNLGRVLTKAGRLPEAIDVLQAAHKLKPNEPVVLENLGLALTQSGRFADAIEQLELAVQLKPDFAEARADLALAHFQNGQVQAAIEQLQMAVKLNPNSAIIHYNLANISAGIGDTAQAIDHFGEAVRLAPNNADYHNYLADMLTKAKQYSAAVDHYQSALQLNPKFLSVYLKLAQSLALLDRSQEVIATSQKGIEVARATGDEAAAGQLEEWFKHYQAELRRSSDANAPIESSATKREGKSREQ